MLGAALCATGALTAPRGFTVEHSDRPGAVDLHRAAAARHRRKLLVFPDENHWVLKPANSVLWHRTVLGWLEQHLKR